jgi:hypothetical protein
MVFDVLAGNLGGIVVKPPRTATLAMPARGTDFRPILSFPTSINSSGGRKSFMRWRVRGNVVTCMASDDKVWLDR